MRHWLRTPAITVLVAPACLPAVSQAQDFDSASQEVDFSFFQDALTPYGEWVDVRGYGPCWHPDVEQDWAPYTNGYWAYTDMGWTWVSHEPFGSIVFHYGRWLLTTGGWCWVPGAEWGPAWVSWRKGPEHVGWAPLPPEVPWHPQRGISAWVDVHTEIGPAYYRFCDARDFCAPNLTTVLFRPTQNLTIMLRTENVTNIWARNNVVYCGGPEYGWIRQRSGVEVPLLRVVREENVQRYYSMNVGGNFGTVQNFVYQDKLVLPAPVRVNITVSQNNVRLRSADVGVSRGWYSDGAANDRLRSHFNQEWEKREAAQHRNPSAYGPSSLEVRVKSVSAAERQGVFSEVQSRGGIAPPSAQRPQHPSYSQGKAAETFSADPDTGLESRRNQQTENRGSSPRQTLPAATGVSRSIPEGQRVQIEGVPEKTGPGFSVNPPQAEPVRRQPSQPFSGNARGAVGQGGANAGAGGSIFSGDPSASPLPRNEGIRPQTLPPSTVPTIPQTQRPSVEQTSVQPLPQSVPQTLPRGGATRTPNGISEGRSFETGRSSVPASGNAAGGAFGNPGLPSQTSSGLSGAPSSQRPAQPVRQDPPAFQRTPNPVPQTLPPSAPQTLPSAQTMTVGPARSGASFQQVPVQQPPVSGARSTVVMPPAQTQPQQTQTQAPSMQRGAPAGVPAQGAAGSGLGSVPSRGGAPAANAAPSGSGASLGTAPASGTPAQSTQKKKPGDPGYVPPQ